MPSPLTEPDREQILAELTEAHNAISFTSRQAHRVKLAISEHLIETSHHAGIDRHSVICIRRSPFQRCR